MWPLIPKAGFGEFPHPSHYQTSRGLMHGYGQSQVDEEKQKAFQDLQDIMQQPEDKRATALKSDPRFAELNIQSQLQKQMQDKNIKEK